MIPKEFWERFKNEKIAVNCQTEDEAKDFIKQCYDNGFKCAFIHDYELNKIILYKFYWLSFNKIDFNSYEIIPYSEINKSIKEENKMQVKPNEYTYRGQVFTDVEEYAKYILKCKEGDRIKTEQERQDKLKAEKTKRSEELEKAYVEYFETCTEAKMKYDDICKSAEEKYNNLVENFNKDYCNCLLVDSPYGVLKYGGILIG